MADALTGLFVPPVAGKGLTQFSYGLLTAWNSTTFANTLTAAGVDFVNVPVVNPAALEVGDVLVVFADGGPIILGILRKP